MLQQRTQAIDRLYQEVLSYRGTENFESLINFVKKFPHISLYNAMLVHMQKPGSVFVASVNDWKKYDRIPKPGARPLLILQPFGPVAFVYEYNDTEGQPLPQGLVDSFQVEGRQISENILDSLIQNVYWEGVEVYRQSYGTNMAGYICAKTPHASIYIQQKEKKYSLSIYHSIVLNNNLSLTAQYATIIHELGHLFCGHVEHDPKKEKWLPDRYYLSKEEREFEAETVCWLVCERNGIINPSAQYLSGYLKNKKVIPSVSIDTVLKATGIIESLIRGNRPPRKELLTELSNKEHK